MNPEARQPIPILTTQSYLYLDDMKGAGWMEVRGRGRPPLPEMGNVGGASFGDLEGVTERLGPCWKCWGGGASGTALGYMAGAWSVARPWGTGSGIWTVCGEPGEPRPPTHTRCSFALSTLPPLLLY